MWRRSTKNDDCKLSCAEVKVFKDDFFLKKLCYYLLLIRTEGGDSCGISVQADTPQELCEATEKVPLKTIISITYVI